MTCITSCKYPAQTVDRRPARRDERSIEQAGSGQDGCSYIPIRRCAKDGDGGQEGESPRIEGTAGWGGYLHYGSLAAGPQLLCQGLPGSAQKAEQRLAAAVVCLCGGKLRDNVLARQVCRRVQGEYVGNLLYPPPFWHGTGMQIAMQKPVMASVDLDVRRATRVAEAHPCGHPYLQPVLVLRNVPPHAGGGVFEGLHTQGPAVVVA